VSDSEQDSEELSSIFRGEERHSEAGGAFAAQRKNPTQQSNKQINSSLADANKAISTKN